MFRTCDRHDDHRNTQYSTVDRYCTDIHYCRPVPSPYFDSWESQKLRRWREENPQRGKEGRGVGSSFHKQTWF